MPVRVVDVEQGASVRGEVIPRLCAACRTHITRRGHSERGEMLLSGDVTSSSWDHRCCGTWLNETGDPGERFWVISRVEHEFLATGNGAQCDAIVIEVPAA